MHISISEFVIAICCRYQVVLSCTCKEYSKKTFKNLKLMATSTYYNQTTYNSYESLRNM